MRTHLTVRASSNMASRAIFQDVNFIRRTYVFVEVAGSRVSLTLVSHRQDTARDALAFLERRGVVLRRKMAPLHLLVVARFEDICLSLCVCSPPRGDLLSLCFFSIHSLSRLFISCSDATDAPLRKGEFWRVVNFINGPHPCRSRLTRLERSRCTSVVVSKNVSVMRLKKILRQSIRTNDPCYVHAYVKQIRFSILYIYFIRNIAFIYYFRVANTTRIYY